MTIDADVEITAKRWGLDPRAIQAVLEAEGNKGGTDPDAILRAVRCSLPQTKTRQDAIEVTCRSWVHAMRDFLLEYHFGPTFVSYFGNRWAPIGASNDPEKKNKHWVPNVTKLWLGDAK